MDGKAAEGHIVLVGVQQERGSLEDSNVVEVCNVTVECIAVVNIVARYIAEVHKRLAYVARDFY